MWFLPYMHFRIKEIDVESLFVTDMMDFQLRRWLLSNFWWLTWWSCVFHFLFINITTYSFCSITSKLGEKKIWQIFFKSNTLIRLLVVVHLFFNLLWMQNQIFCFRSPYSLFPIMLLYWLPMRAHFLVCKASNESPTSIIMIMWCACNI